MGLYYLCALVICCRDPLPLQVGDRVSVPDSQPKGAWEVKSGIVAYIAILQSAEFQWHESDLLIAM